MDTQIVVVFCLSDDLLKALHHHEDKQCQMSDAEVMTTAIIAMLYFRGNFCLASRFLYDGRYIPNMLGKSRFNRRLHRIADLFLTLFLRLGETWKQLNEKSVYVVDSYPIAVCDNYRIGRSNIYQGKDWRGYIPSKKRFFFGVRIHILVTEKGEPVEFFLTPGAFSDTRALALYNFDLPAQSWVTGDRAYNDYTIEDVMREAGIELLPLRKKNSLRPVPAYMRYLQFAVRKIVETTGSLIERLLPKSIHAVTARGFELKVALFVLASSINFLW
jgi:DDE family transposase